MKKKKLVNFKKLGCSLRFHLAARQARLAGLSRPTARSAVLGMVLTEALVAMATLTTGVIALSTIINNAISTLAVSRDYMIAQNLVTEGVELVRAIRDSNWLILPTEKECWLYLKPYTLVTTSSHSCSTGSVKVSNTSQNPPLNSQFNYLPIFSTKSNLWELYNVTATADNSAGTLNLDSISSPPAKYNLANIVNLQNEYVLYLKNLGNGQFRYVQNESSVPTKSKFYRSIVFTEKGDEKATFVVKVQWFEGAKVRTIKRKSTIYNYL